VRHGWQRRRSRRAPRGDLLRSSACGGLERLAELPALTAEQQSEAALLAQKVYDNYHRRHDKRE